MAAQAAIHDRSRCAIEWCDLFDEATGAILDGPADRERFRR
jgi:hypothetical protein